MSQFNTTTMRNATQKLRAPGGTFDKMTNGALVGALASTVGFVLIELVYLHKKTSQINGKSLAIAMVSGAGAFAFGAIGLEKMGFYNSDHQLLKHVKDGAGVGVFVSAPVLLLVLFFGSKDMDARQVMIIASSIVMGFAAIALAIYMVRYAKGDNFEK